jgi:hypothetical protein
MIDNKALLTGTISEDLDPFEATIHCTYFLTLDRLKEGGDCQEYAKEENIQWQ